MNFLKKPNSYMYRSYLFLLLNTLWFSCSCSGVTPEPGKNGSLANNALLQKHVQALVSAPGYRNYKDTATLNRAADYIKSEFLKITEQTETQVYKVEGKEYKNVICSLGPREGERIIIGAHYDVYGNQPGADDNASGVAGLLEMARLLSLQNLKYRIDLVAYTLEEPPFFRGNAMGSFVHAQSLYAQKVPVKGMVCLEMIGYFNSEPKSQRYPVSIMRWFYGNTGDYILVVQKFGNGSFGRQFNKEIRKNATINTKFIRSPKFITGIDFSDHRNYWNFGFNAVMITNTAFYRNHNYHLEGDSITTLDFNRMAKVVDQVYFSIINLK